MRGTSTDFVTLPATFRIWKGFKTGASAVSSERGFSLLEVLFGAAIVGVAAAGLAMMFGTSQSMVQGGGDNRTAITVAQQRMEQVRSAGFGAASLPDPREEAGVIGVPINNFSDADAVPGFRRRTIITGVCPTNFALAYNDGLCPTNPNIEAKLVTVMVRMKELGSNLTDIQTQPIILQSVLVKK